LEHTRSGENRRRSLIRALASGLLAAASPAARAQLLGKVPRKLPPGQSIYDIRGQVLLNGRKVGPEAVISPKDTIATGKDSRIIFVVGKDAFLMRESSRLALNGSGRAVHSLRLVTGALLSVFGKSEHALIVPTGTVGIRGTGVYAEAQPERSYVCTCYGITELSAAGTAEKERIESTYHNAPRFILAAGANRIQPAPFINHTDEELMLIEALVGRVPPFALFDDTYGRSSGY
jgi:hypothetical protein